MVCFYTIRFNKPKGSLKSDKIIMKEHSLFSEGLSALHSMGSACVDVVNSTGKACSEVLDQAKTPTTVVVYKPKFVQIPEQSFTVS